MIIGGGGNPLGRRPGQMPAQMPAQRQMPAPVVRRAPAAPRPYVPQSTAAMLTRQQQPQQPMQADPFTAEVRNNLIPYLRAIQAQYKYDHGARGKLSLRWTIGPDGHVGNVVAVEDTMPSAAFKKQVASAVARWRFPATGTQTEVAFPFIFV